METRTHGQDCGFQGTSSKLAKLGRSNPVQEPDTQVLPQQRKTRILDTHMGPRVSSPQHHESWEIAFTHGCHLGEKHGPVEM